jgi:hypothetical protein
MKSQIRKILKEEFEPTETEVLYWKLPKKMVDELGFELYNEDDVVYIEEIHFDTQNVLFSFNVKNEWGEETNYDDTIHIPGSFEGYKPIPVDKLPESVLTFILRRLSSSYTKYIK